VARPDVVSTAPGQPVTIPVLGNDSSGLLPATLQLIDPATGGPGRHGHRAGRGQLDGERLHPLPSSSPSPSGVGIGEPPDPPGTPGPSVPPQGGGGGGGPLPDTGAAVIGVVGAGLLALVAGAFRTAVARRRRES
jgi:hypothetical protein